MFGVICPIAPPGKQEKPPPAESSPHRGSPSQNPWTSLSTVTRSTANRLPRPSVLQSSEQENLAGMERPKLNLETAQSFSFATAEGSNNSAVQMTRYVRLRNSISLSKCSSSHYNGKISALDNLGNNTLKFSFDVSILCLRRFFYYRRKLVLQNLIQRINRQ